MLDGAPMEIADLVTAVTAANQAVLAPAPDLYQYLTDGIQKVIVVVADDSASPEVLLLHSSSETVSAGDIVAMVGEAGGDGIATLVRMTEQAHKPRTMVTLSKVAYEAVIGDDGAADETHVKRLRRTSADYVDINVGATRVLPAAAA